MRNLKLSYEEALLFPTFLVSQIGVSLAKKNTNWGQAVSHLVKRTPYSV